MKKVEVYNAVEDGKLGVGVKVVDENATLKDLLDVWQPLCDDQSIYKMYAAGNHSVCKGCQVNCCNTAYVMPDLVAFKKMAARLNCDYINFIKDYFQADKVDAGLLRMKPNPCIFLKDNICTIYPDRSLICRFYLCANILGDTQELIYSITWAGVTATQLFAEKNGLIKTNQCASQSSFDLMLHKLITSYRESNKVKPFFAAREYNDIPLKPFLPVKG